MGVLRAGQLRAPALRDALFGVGYLISDAAVFSIDVLTEVAGIAAALEPKSEYAIDGYLAFDTSAAAGFKFCLDVPSGAVGHWGSLGVFDTSNVGAANGFRTGFGAAHFVNLSGAATGSACVVSGYVATVPGGALRVLLAQTVATASTTVVKAGSWLRLSKIS